MYFINIVYLNIIYYVMYFTLFHCILLLLFSIYYLVKCFHCAFVHWIVILIISMLSYHVNQITTDRNKIPTVQLHLRHSSFSNPSVDSPMSQLILPTSKALHLRHLPSRPWLLNFKRNCPLRTSGWGRTPPPEPNFRYATATAPKN